MKPLYRLIRYQYHIARYQMDVKSHIDFIGTWLIFDLHGPFRHYANLNNLPILSRLWEELDLKNPI